MAVRESVGFVVACSSSDAENFMSRNILVRLITVRICFSSQRYYISSYKKFPNVEIDNIRLLSPEERPYFFAVKYFKGPLPDLSNCCNFCVEWEWKRAVVTFLFLAKSVIFLFPVCNRQLPTHVSRTTPLHQCISYLYSERACACQWGGHNDLNLSCC